MDTSAVIGVLNVAALVVLGVAVISLRDTLAGLRALLAPIHRLLEASPSQLSSDVQKQLRDLEDLVDRLPQRWELLKEEANAIFNRARAAEERTRGAVNRARQELADRGLLDDGIEEQARELRLLDGGGSEEEGMPAMHQGMADGGQPVQPRPMTEAEEEEFVRRALRGG